jgi:hypothetical protein
MAVEAEGNQMEVGVVHLLRAAAEEVHHPVEGVELPHIDACRGRARVELLGEVRRNLDRSQTLDNRHSRTLVVLLEEVEELAAAMEQRRHQARHHHTLHSCRCPYFRSPRDELRNRRRGPGRRSRRGHGRFDRAAKAQLHRWAGAAMV